MKNLKWILALLMLVLGCGNALADPFNLTVTRDNAPNDSRVIFRWRGDGSTQYRLWYSNTWPINFGGLSYIDIDVTLPNYTACSPAVTPTGSFPFFDYTYCYNFSSTVQYFAVTSVTTGSCVYGTVTDGSGNPLAGVSVCFERPSPPDTCTYTNGVGEYAICGLSAGDHNVHISYSCDAPQNGVVTVDADNAVQYDIQFTVTPIVQKSGHITSNETWTSGNVYQLYGQVIVDPGVVLTIEPGTKIIGSYPTLGVLILAAGPENCSPGGGIYAVGTSTNPIVFTSNRPCGQRGNGDWGGIVINGRAHDNRGVVPNGEGDSGPYGLGDPCLGNTACDAAPNGSEITLRYVRLEFSGYRFTPVNELNGLCLQGVSAGADISYIQVQRGQDDGLEFFGGTASVHHIIISEMGDDGFDWTDGPQMAGAFIVVHQRMADSDAGIEADNYEFGHDCLPRAHPYLSNFTFVGGKGTASVGVNGQLFRRGTEVTVNNFITMACKNAGLDIDDGSTAINSNNGGALGTYDASRMSYDYSLFWDNGGAATEVLDGSTGAGIGDGHFYWENGEFPATAAFPVNSMNIAAPDGWTQDISNYRGSGAPNSFVGTNATNAAADPMLVNPLGSVAPSGFGYDAFNYDARPVLGSPALGGAAPVIPAPPYLPPWWPLPTPTYRGAFSGPTDSWADGWTSYPVN